MRNAITTLDQLTGSKIAGVNVDTGDVLELNFFAAAGLPGSEKSNLDMWLAKRDEWAARIKFEVCRHLYRFDLRSQQEPTPYTYGSSLGRFICWIALQVLQEQCGVRYHPDRKFKPDFCQPPDVFAHGIMDDGGHGGTCASMPVVYVSVLRSLGLPVYLVETRGHAFFRWDDPKGITIEWENPNLVLWVPPQRFNVEGSGEGIAFYPDDYYTIWPERWRPIEFEKGGYLKSMTAKEALAGFLIERGECFWELGNTVEALKSYHYARQVAPENQRYKWLHGKRSHEYQQFEAADRAIEDRVRKAYEQQFVPGEHSLYCKCAKCQGPKVQRWQPSVQERTSRPTEMAGHPTSCQCSGCQMQREMPRLPGQLALGVANYPPNHAIPGHAIPGLHDLIPSFTGF